MPMVGADMNGCQTKVTVGRPSVGVSRWPSESRTGGRPYKSHEQGYNANRSVVRGQSVVPLTTDY